MTGGISPFIGIAPLVSVDTGQHRLAPLSDKCFLKGFSLKLGGLSGHRHGVQKDEFDLINFNSNICPLKVKIGNFEQSIQILHCENTVVCPPIFVSQRINSVNRGKLTGQESRKVI